jgi:protein CrcB
VERIADGRHPGPGRALAVAAGGALGTLARYTADRGLPAETTAFPWSTFLVNVSGSFVLGAILTLIVERWSPTRFVRPFAAIGFCGGFTTFSTFAVEIVQRGQHDRIGLAIAYLVASLVVGLAAAVAGITLARGRVIAVGIGRNIPDPDDVGVLFDTGADNGLAVSSATGDDEDEDTVHA